MTKSIVHDNASHAQDAPAKPKKVHHTAYYDHLFNGMSERDISAEAKDLVLYILRHTDGAPGHYPFVRLSHDELMHGRWKNKDERWDHGISTKEKKTLRGVIEEAGLNGFIFQVKPETDNTSYYYALQYYWREENLEKLEQLPAPTSNYQAEQRDGQAYVLKEQRQPKYYGKKWQVKRAAKLGDIIPQLQEMQSRGQYPLDETKLGDIVPWSWGTISPSAKGQYPLDASAEASQEAARAVSDTSVIPEVIPINNNIPVSAPNVAHSHVDLEQEAQKDEDSHQAREQEDDLKKNQHTSMPEVAPGASDEFVSQPTLATAEQPRSEPTGAQETKAPSLTFQTKARVRSRERIDSPEAIIQAENEEDASLEKLQAERCGLQAVITQLQQKERDLEHQIQRASVGYGNLREAKEAERINTRALADALRERNDLDARIAAIELKAVRAHHAEALVRWNALLDAEYQVNPELQAALDKDERAVQEAVAAATRKNDDLRQSNAELERLETELERLEKLVKRTRQRSQLALVS